MQDTPARGAMNVRLIVVAGLLIVGLLISVLVDFTLGLALLVGVVVAWPLRRLIANVARWFWGHKLLLALSVLVVLGLSFFTLILLIGLVGGGGSASGPCQVPLVFEADDLRAGRFTVSAPDQSGPPTQVQVSGHRRSLLLKEVALNVYDDLGVSSGCNGVDVYVTLKDLPRAVFYQAKEAEDVERQTYLDTETIQWRQSDPTVTFSYIPPALRFARPAADLLYGLGSLGQIVTGLGGLLFGWVVEPILGDAVKERLKQFIKSRFGRRGAKDA